MGFRSLVLLSIVASTFSLALSARADVPPADAGTGGASTLGGAGGEAYCTVAAESTAGSTCAEVTCPSGSNCNDVPSGYNYVCTSSSTTQVWCNGPARNTPSDQNVACAVAVLGAPRNVATGVVAGSALALALALRARRRRRS